MKLKWPQANASPTRGLTMLKFVLAQQQYKKRHLKLMITNVLFMLANDFGFV
jgi:hypothetical protein